MTRKILTYLISTTLLLSSTPLVCFAEDNSINKEFYPSCIEEYDAVSYTHLTLPTMAVV